MLQKSENLKDHPIDYSTGVMYIGFPAQFTSFATQFNSKSTRFHDSCDRLGDPSFEFFFIYSKLLFVQQTVQLSQWNLFFKHAI